MIGGPALVTQPSMAASLGPIVFVVVVVGGLGSLPGAFIASLLIGLIQTFAVALERLAGRPAGAARHHARRATPFGGDLWMATVAQVAPIIPYLLLVLMLIFRPQGPDGRPRDMSAASRQRRARRRR